MILKCPIKPKFKITAENNGIIDKAPQITLPKNKEVISPINKTETTILNSADLITINTISRMTTIIPVTLIFSVPKKCLSIYVVIDPTSEKISSVLMIEPSDVIRVVLWS